MKIDLLLTLGHNSSAIAVTKDEPHTIVCGYEEERFSHIKSDSNFPKQSIRRCMGVAKTDSVENVYVTHWAVDGKLSSMKLKHWSVSDLPTINGLVISHNDHDFTHHDCHAHAALWYAAGNDKLGLNQSTTMIFVIDGFGNFGEHITIYCLDKLGRPEVVRRLFGYSGSLGLMYQYMTAFLGMKQHEDEYKILGYETHLSSLDIDIGLINQIINKETARYLNEYFDSSLALSDSDPLLHLNALPTLQKKLIDRWKRFCQLLDLEEEGSFKTRVAMSYIVQSVLEGVVLTLVKIYRPANLIASGGVFYNVKLNRRIAEEILGKLCVYPLAGDQGNAIGLYTSRHKLEWPGHLFWGVRPSHSYYSSSSAFINTGSRDIAIKACQRSIEQYGMVNLVRGPMEFGPRALCNTSTLAIPSPAIVSKINQMNGRNTVMPMAPVMNRSTYHAKMKLTDKIHRSEEHMIVALPYRDGEHLNCLGAAHRYEDEYTGRPQVLDNDPILDHLLAEHPVLINTSFNVHGRPIVYLYEDAIFNHSKQCTVNPITTVYLGEEQ